MSFMAPTADRVADSISAICVEISRVAAPVRCESDFTSLATTAKPRPFSPARAASIVAFSASRLVWFEMPAISPMISVTRADNSANRAKRFSASSARATASITSILVSLAWRPTSWLEACNSSTAAATAPIEPDVVPAPSRTSATPPRNSLISRSRSPTIACSDSACVTAMTFDASISASTACLRSTASPSRATPSLPARKAVRLAPMSTNTDSVRAATSAAS